jgi:hypothetical protein
MSGVKVSEGGDELSLQPRPLPRGGVNGFSLEGDDSRRLHPLEQSADFFHGSIQKLTEEVDRNREVSALIEKQFHDARELSLPKCP